MQVKGKNKNNEPTKLPITLAKKPNVLALAGIWKDRNISFKELRKLAWGNRY